MRYAKSMAGAALILLLSASASLAQNALIDTLKFRDADIRLVLQAIAQKATRDDKKINIIMTPEVQGLVTVDLEGVNWETALKVLLKTYGFGYTEYKGVIIVASLDKIKETETKEIERQAVESPQLKIFKLKYLDANDARRAVEPLLSANGKASVLETTGQSGWEFGAADLSKRNRVKEGKLSRTKILIVSDTTKKLDEVSSLLDTIDVMPKQILIKTRIMEVNRNLLRDIGFDWATGSSGAESSTIFPTPTSKSNGIDLTELGAHVLGAQAANFIPKSTGLTTDNSGLKLVFKKLTGAQFEVILHALEEDARSNTLSAPVLLTLNNQEAAILVGTKYPIIETQISTQTNYVIGGTLREYKDIGIQLNVVPQVWGEKDELINIIVHPAVTSYSQAKVMTQDKTVLVEYPIITAREAETQLVLRDGETIVMGGLLKDVKTKYDIGVPFLSKIPLIGNIFKRDTYNTEKIDLLIFITARIIKPGETIPQEVVNISDMDSKFDKEGARMPVTDEEKKKDRPKK